MKTCPKCEAEKPFDAFAVDQSKSDGRKAQCKECDAAKKRKGYYATSPKARSNRTVLQRHRRWRDIADAHGERWLIEQVQCLKDTGRLPYAACEKADQDDRLAAFFREADKASSATLRTHLGSRTWDRVLRPFVTKVERKARSAESRERLQALLATEIVGLEWNDDEGRLQGIFESPEDDGPSFADFLQREASDRILRKGRFTPKRPEKD